MICYETTGYCSGRTHCYGDIDIMLQGPDPFTGITLYLTEQEDRFGERWGGGVFLENTSAYDIDRVFNVLKELDLMQYIQSKEQILKEKKIHFSEDLPFYLVVMITGFFRLYDNYTQFLDNWDRVSKVISDPYLKYALSITYSKYQLREQYHAWFSDEHSPVDSSCCTPEGLRMFRTFHERLKTLRPMSKEFEATHNLSYYGRDDFFTHCSYHDYKENGFFNEYLTEKDDYGDPYTNKDCLEEVALKAQEVV